MNKSGKCNVSRYRKTKMPKLLKVTKKMLQNGENNSLQVSSLKNNVLILET